MSFFSEHYIDPVAARVIHKIWCLDNSQDNALGKGNLLLRNWCFNIEIVQGEGLYLQFGEKSMTLRKDFIYFHR